MSWTRSYFVVLTILLGCFYTQKSTAQLVMEEVKVTGQNSGPSQSAQYIFSFANSISGPGSSGWERLGDSDSGDAQEPNLMEEVKVVGTAVFADNYIALSLFASSGSNMFTFTEAIGEGVEFIMEWNGVTDKHEKCRAFVYKRTVEVPGGTDVFASVITVDTDTNEFLGYEEVSLAWWSHSPTCSMSENSTDPVIGPVDGEVKDPVVSVFHPQEISMKVTDSWGRQTDTCDVPLMGDLCDPRPKISVTDVSGVSTGNFIQVHMGKKYKGSTSAYTYSDDYVMCIDSNSDRPSIRPSYLSNRYTYVYTAYYVSKCEHNRSSSFLSSSDYKIAGSSVYITPIKESDSSGTTDPEITSDITLVGNTSGSCTSTAVSVPSTGLVSIRYCVSNANINFKNKYQGQAGEGDINCSSFDKDNGGPGYVDLGGDWYPDGDKWRTSLPVNFGSKLQVTVCLKDKYYGGYIKSLVTLER